MKKIFTSLMAFTALLFCAGNASAEEYVLTPSAVTTIDAAAADENQYNAEATSWNISQGAISGTSLKSYNLKNLVMQFDLAKLKGLTVQSAVISYDSKCTVSGKNSNVELASINPAWDVTTVTWNSLNADAQAVQISAGTGQNVKTSTVNLKENVLNYIKPGETIAFAIYTYTAREQMISNIKLTVVAIDASAAVDVKVNYVCDGTTVKTSSVTGTKGNAVSLAAGDIADFVEAGQKYIYVSDNSAETTAAEGAEVTVTVRKAATYSYSLVSSQGGAVATGTGFEGDVLSVAYPHYQLIENTLYAANVTNKEYNVSLTLDADNKEQVMTYNSSKEGVVYYSEAEDINGLTPVTYGNIKIRASKSLAAKATEDTKITNLPAGKYIIHAGVFSSAKTPAYIIKIGLGENVYEAPVTAVNASEVASAEYTITSAADLTLFAEGMTDNNALDYIYIEKTGDIAPAVVAATFDDITLDGENTVKYFEGENPATEWTSGSYTFSTYTATYGAYKYYSSYAVSNKTTTSGKLSDYALESACGGAKSGSNYAVWYDNTYNGGDVIKSAAAGKITGVYVTNTTTVVDAVINGDGMSTVAGGFQNGDVCTLTFTGYKDGAETGKAEFKLAYAESDVIYYAKDWKWVSLESLGEVDNVKVAMTSTKANSYGATTPLYFCLDDFGGVAPETDAEYASTAIATAIANVAAPSAVRNGKFIQNGKVVIIKNGVKYTVAGQLIK